MTIEPPRPTGLPNTSATAGPATQASAVREAPAGLRAAVSGTIITAVSAGRDAQGHLMLRTANGMLTLATQTNPPIGSTVTLQLRPAGAQMQAYILSVRPAQAGTPQTAGQPAAPASPAFARSAGPPALPGQTTAPASGSGDRLSSGTPLRASLAATPASAPTVDGNGTSLPRLRAGDTLDVRLLRVQAPDGPASGSASRVSGGDGIARPMIVSGRVVAPDGGGGVLLRTPLGTLRLPLATPPPAGTLMTLEVARPNRSPATAGAPGAPLAAPALSRAWPALQDAMAAVQRPGVPAAHVDLPQLLSAPGNPIAQAVPRAGPTLGAGLLFLMSAFKGGDIGRWLGAEPLRTLERAGRGDLAGRLKADFGQLSRLAQDAGGDWRLFALPVIGDGDVQQIRFFLRKHDGDDATAPPDRRPPGRFVVELTLSELGELQLDGLARPERLDAVLRSRTPLPAGIEREVTRIFDEQVAAHGLYGDLRFEASGSWHFIEIDATDEHTGLRA
ncbi:hypothetical protein CKO28_09460 [Rhodovibrio sodomensis]|uniref:Flagellar hook-length control protein-like C-terminal domain-containing protein n=1 Tax=Rhodovibrio sodomensis TaxID=1088 RepID=A0ABS1DCS6_9PROT|nr:hypothetical protein [Rhodovibrio sodomensis]MBK1668262.1 hypothetical protein [Rhodovibrio sodomensis]